MIDYIFSNTFAIIGSGGLAKEIRFLLGEIIWDNTKIASNIGTFSNIGAFLGYISEDVNKIIHNERVIGNDDWLLKRTETTAVIFGIGSPLIIKKLTEKYKQNGYLWFPNMFHPNVTGNFENIKLGIGNIITSGCALTTDINIGNFNIFNLHTTIGHDVIIGDYNLFNPGTHISGNVKIGNGCLFGTGCQVLEKLSIADNTIIGSGAVVVKSIEEENGVYVGVPAKRIK